VELGTDVVDLGANDFIVEFMWHVPLFRRCCLELIPQVIDCFLIFVRLNFELGPTIRDLTLGFGYLGMTSLVGSSYLVEFRPNALQLLTRSF
jgi:hypothetical protein